jgi:hypothetical protein
MITRPLANARFARRAEAMRLLLPPGVVTALFWVTALNSVSVLQGAVAYLLLFVPWWSYSVWKREGQTQLPFFAIVAFMYWLFYAVPLFWGDRVRPSSGIAQLVSDGTITQTMLMALLGVGALWLGMRSRLGARFALHSRRDIPADASRWGYLRFLLVACSLLSLFPDITSITGAGGQQLIAILQSSIPLIVFIILFRNFLRGTSTRLDRYAMLLYIAVQFILGLSSGWLGSWLTVALAGLATYLAERKRIPLIPVLVVLAYALFFQAGKQDYRSVYWSGGVQQSNPIQRVEAWAQLSLDKWKTILSSQGQGFGPQLIQDVVQRLNLLNQTANVVEATPSTVPYQYGRTYPSVALNLIPRFIWPDKPSVNEANQLYQVTYGLTSRQNLNQVSIAVGVLTEGYINLGWPGVVIVMFLLGILFSFVEASFLSRESGLFYSAIGIAILLHFTAIEEQMAQYLGGTIQTVVLALLLLLPATHMIGQRGRPRMPGS